MCFCLSFLIFFSCLIKYEFCHLYLRVLTFMFALSDVLVSWDKKFLECNLNYFLNVVISTSLIYFAAS